MARLCPPPRLCAAALAALFAAGPCVARAEEKPSEYAVKAAFLRSAVRLVDWPAERRVPLEVCVLGEDPFGATLDAIAGTAGDLSLEVQRHADARAARACEVVFVAASERGRLRAVLAVLAGSGALTVGDTEGFAAQGVILNFYLDGSKVRFEVNVDAARAAGVALQPRLVSLGRVVRGS
ncbi:MAG TPA: YfiR family protein [Anaeromyxobacter sp.]|nr:YfiR family protein [Anaeromyxobacter sp.]